VGQGMEDLWDDIQKLMSIPLKLIIYESDQQRISLANFVHGHSDEEAAHFRITDVDEHDIAIIMYTSGTNLHIFFSIVRSR
jgi:acyl-coenzyme A synthetase/AMP-(fatty) acid ligase